MSSEEKAPRYNISKGTLERAVQEKAETRDWENDYFRNNHYKLMKVNHTDRTIKRLLSWGKIKFEDLTLPPDVKSLVVTDERELRRILSFLNDGVFFSILTVISDKPYTLERLQEKLPHIDNLLGVLNKLMFFDLIETSTVRIGSNKHTLYKGKYNHISIDFRKVI